VQYNQNHYETLSVQRSASQSEIKQAYRRLVKQFHPDCNPDAQAKERMIAINAAYEVLGDRQRRQRYDDETQAQYAAMRSHVSTSPFRTQTHHRNSTDVTDSRSDECLKTWINDVYRPLDRRLARILHSLDRQIDDLSADPFDDELMGVFCQYLEDAKSFLDDAQRSFQSQPNPRNLAGVAADVYYCLDRLSDGLEELEYFTLNYDDRHLHMGQELFRIAIGLRASAFQGIRDFL